MYRQLLLSVALFAQLALFGQDRYKTMITSQIAEDFQIKIDHQLQTIEYARNFAVSNIPPKAKVLQVCVWSKNKFVATKTIGTSGAKTEYYEVVKSGDTFKVNECKEFKFDFSKNVYIVNYKPLLPQMPIDSSKLTTGCKLKDSAINEIVINMGKLKQAKAIDNYLSTALQYKCLQVSQLKSIAYRLVDDDKKWGLIQKHYKYCLNPKDFKDLMGVFTSQKYSNMLEEWLKSKKL